MQIRLFFDYEEGPHDIVLCADGEPIKQIKVLFRDVTADAAEKLAAEFDLVDPNDVQQVMAIQADVAARAPRSYSWHWQETQKRQAQAAPARRYNGQFKSAGVRS